MMMIYVIDAHIPNFQIADPLDVWLNSVAVDSDNSDDFYSGPIESYRTLASPINMDNTFEKLHLALSLNDHDSLFHI